MLKIQYGNFQKSCHVLTHWKKGVERENFTTELIITTFHKITTYPTYYQHMDTGPQTYMLHSVIVALKLMYFITSCIVHILM